MERQKGASEDRLQMLIAASTTRACEGKPGPSILSMDNQRGRITLFSINKQNDHLAVAIVGSMVGAGTVGVGQTGQMQIECLHDTETGIG